MNADTIDLDPPRLSPWAIVAADWLLCAALLALGMLL